MNFPLFFFLFFFLLVFSVFPQFKAKETLIFVSFFFSRQALRIGTPMGRLPHGGGPVFRFTSGEVNQPSNFLGFSCIIIEFTYLVLCMIFLTKKSALIRTYHLYFMYCLTTSMLILRTIKAQFLLISCPFYWKLVRVVLLFSLFDFSLDDWFWFLYIFYQFNTHARTMAPTFTLFWYETHGWWESWDCSTKAHL